MRKMFGSSQGQANDNRNNSNSGDVNNTTKTEAQSITNKQPPVWVAGKSLKECMGNQKIIDNNTIQCQRGYFKE